MWGKRSVLPLARLHYPYHPSFESLTEGPLAGGALYRQLGWRAPFIFLLILLTADIVLRLLIIEKKEAMRWIEKGVTIPGFSAPGYPSRPSKEEANVAVASTPDSSSSDATEVTAAILPKLIPDSTSLWQTTWRLLHNSRAAVALSMAFLYGADFGLLEAGMVLYVKELYGLDEQGAGLIFLAVVIPSFIVRYVSRKRLGLTC